MNKRVARDRAEPEVVAAVVGRWLELQAVEQWHAGGAPRAKGVALAAVLNSAVAAEQLEAIADVGAGAAIGDVGEDVCGSERSSG